MVECHTLNGHHAHPWTHTGNECRSGSCHSKTVTVLCVMATSKQQVIEVSHDIPV